MVFRTPFSEFCKNVIAVKLFKDICILTDDLCVIFAVNIKIIRGKRAESFCSIAEEFFAVFVMKEFP